MESGITFENDFERTNLHFSSIFFIWKWDYFLVWIKDDWFCGYSTIRHFSVLEIDDHMVESYERMWGPWECESFRVFWLLWIWILNVKNVPNKGLAGRWVMCLIANWFVFFCGLYSIENRFLNLKQFFQELFHTKKWKVNVYNEMIEW